VAPGVERGAGERLVGVERRAEVHDVHRAAGEQLAALAAGPAEGTTSGASTWVVAEALGAGGNPLAQVTLEGADPYAFTAAFMAWAARRCAGGHVTATGALGPVEAFGLDELEGACRAAGLVRAPG
jgi:hypothetical protein